MRIIGIDPGTATTGFSIVESKNGEMRLLDFGTIRTQAGIAQGVRLNEIAKDISELIQKWNPQEASIEKLFFQKNAKTAMAVSEARGIIIQKLTEKGITTKEYTPPEIKSAVCGNGNADKKMIQQMVKMIFGLEKIPEPDDAADAIAAAVCLINSHKLAKQINGK